jgi:ABC-type dipeptide/oligopeptide/nickel transport system permease component
LKIRIKGTLEIAALGFGVAVIIGIPAGIGSAVNHNGWKDNVLSVLTLIMASIPSFCLALFLVLLLALHLRLLPVFGLYSWKGYIIPTLVLGAGGIAMTTRMTRSAVLEILNLPYITTLRAKGMSERKILWVHVLKNALPPIISVMNNVAISVLCSTIVVENFFTVVGIGTMLVSAVGNRSQHQVLACTLVLAVVILVINFITDVCYILTNPRLRMEQSKKSGSKEKENG